MQSTSRIHRGYDFSDWAGIHVDLDKVVDALQAADVKPYEFMRQAWLERRTIDFIFDDEGNPTVKRV